MTRRADGVDTLVVIRLDSLSTEHGRARTRQPRSASSWKCQGNLLVVAPHHDIGDDPEGEFRSSRRR